MQPGGQLTITTEVENFPGYPNGVDGTQMMMDMKEQAARFGAEMRDGSIVKADFSSRPFHLTDERDNEIEAETVIIATGASAKYLGLADEEKYRGTGRFSRYPVTEFLPQAHRSRSGRWRYCLRRGHALIYLPRRFT